MTNSEINTHDAKTNLSKYLKRVQQGEIITLCKNGEPIAQIVPFKKPSKKRILGVAKGVGVVTDKFFEDLTEDDLPGMGL